MISFNLVWSDFFCLLVKGQEISKGNSGFFNIANNDCTMLQFDLILSGDISFVILVKGQEISKGISGFFNISIFKWLYFFDSTTS